MQIFLGTNNKAIRIETPRFGISCGYNKENFLKTDHKNSTYKDKSTSLKVAHKDKKLPINLSLTS